MSGSARSFTSGCAGPNRRSHDSCRPARGHRRLAPHCRTHAVQIRVAHWPRPAHPSRRFFLFAAFLAMSLLLRKSFCGWLCPVGTLSEYLWKLGRSTFRRNFALPRWLDIVLRSLKYVLLAFFAYAVFNMSATAIAEFLPHPTDSSSMCACSTSSAIWRYGGIRHPRPDRRVDLRTELLVPLSLSLRSPHGTGSAPQSAAHHPARPACIDCAKCAKACPAALPVDKLVPEHAPPSAPDAWNVLRSVPRKTLWFLPLPESVPSQPGAWRQGLRSSFSD